jgi:hypothetical protein
MAYVVDLYLKTQLQWSHSRKSKTETGMTVSDMVERHWKSSPLHNASSYSILSSSLSNVRLNLYQHTRGLFECGKLRKIEAAERPRISALVTSHCREKQCPNASHPSSPSQYQESPSALQSRPMENKVPRRMPQKQRRGLTFPPH